MWHAGLGFQVKLMNITMPNQDRQGRMLKLVCKSTVHRLSHRRMHALHDQQL